MRNYWVVLTDRRTLSKEHWEKKKKQIANLNEVFQQFKGALTPAMRKGLTHSFTVLPKVIDELWEAYPLANLKVSELIVILDVLWYISDIFWLM